MDSTHTQRNMEVKWLEEAMPQAEDIKKTLDKAGVEFQTIDCANWSTDYPYKPEVDMRMAFCEDGILLHYRVSEEAIRAHFAKDNGDVWTDSCVEFFSIPAGDGVYYNLECNCIGTILLGAGAGRKDRTRASQEVLNTIARWSTLKHESFDTLEEPTRWEVALVVPFSAFFMHEGRVVKEHCRQHGLRANFYKCGDNLPHPHFLSWSAIDLPKPNFHCPEFFGNLAVASL